jgi:SAM-dependent methyltransferase
MRKLEGPAGRFDGAIAAFSLIHVPKANVDRVLANFRRALKSGGLLYLSVHEGVGEVVLNEPLCPEKRIFLSLFQEAEVERLLGKFGFKMLLARRIKSKSKAEYECDKLFFIAKKAGGIPRRHARRRLRFRPRSAENFRKS